MTASKQSFFAKPIGILLITLIGILIWALHFAVVYGVQHIVCTAFAGEHSGFWIKTVIIVTTIIALLVLLLPILKPKIMLPMSRFEALPQDTQAFLIGMMQLLALLSCFGVLWGGSTALLLPACGSLA